MAERQRRRPRCPVCGVPADPDHAPFCSSRCGEIDLGRWLSGRYAIAGEPVAEADGGGEDGGAGGREDGGAGG